MELESRLMNELDSLRVSEDQHKHAQTDELELSTLTSRTEPDARSPRRRAFFDWIWECSALALVLVALAAMIGIMLAAQGQSAGIWRSQHYNVSVNAIIALLTGLVKGGCMFVVAQVIGQTKWQWFATSRRLGDFGRIDDASRGPWGSAQLLSRMRAPNLALMGAVISVTALAVDPFTQNTIATHDCQIQSGNQTVNVPITQTWWDTGAYFAQRVNYTDGMFALWGYDQRFESSTPIRAAVYSGLYGAATTVASGSTVKIGCPGVNCTLPTYSTVGVCHKCADISTYIKKTCDTTTSSSTNGFHSPCTWSLPNGQSLGSQPQVDDWIISSKANQLGNFNTVWAFANATPSALTLPNLPGTFANLSILANVSTQSSCIIGMLHSPQANCNLTNSSSMAPIYQFNTLGAECSLFPCVRTLNASFKDGNLVETEINRTFGQNKNWLAYPGNDEPPFPSDSITINLDEPCPPDRFNVTRKGGCSYTFDARSVAALGNFFWQFWNGTVSGAHWEQATISNNVLEAMYNRGFTNFSRIDGMLGGIADSMTAAIREAKDQDLNSTNLDIRGQVFVTDQCIEIRWVWMTLPALVAFGTLILLVYFVFIGMTSLSRPVWKSSTLPILLYGIHATDRVSDGQSLSLAQMNKDANRVWAKMSSEKDGIPHLMLRSK